MPRETITKLDEQLLIAAVEALAGEVSKEIRMAAKWQDIEEQTIWDYYNEACDKAGHDIKAGREMKREP